LLCREFLANSEKRERKMCRGKKMSISVGGL
jgi:hypothetical protein